MEGLRGKGGAVTLLVLEVKQATIYKAHGVRVSRVNTQNRR